MSPQARHAVVVGGSLAGLAAAGTLVRHFDAVTLIERDRYPENPVHRKGVPQGRHLHALLTGGLHALEGLFPGFEAELLAAGAVPQNVPGDWLWLTRAGWCTRFQSAHTILSATRQLIDWVLRRRVEALAQVTIVSGVDVTGLLGAGNGVTGVAARVRDGGKVAEFAADLVVDASGRSTRMPDWLEALGYGRPMLTRIDAGLGYATRVYALPDGFDGDWKALYLQTKPPETTRMGITFQVEGGRWMLTLGGAGGDHPPTDDDGFLAFAATLRHPIIYETFRNAEPLTPIYGFHHSSNQRWHYEAMPRWPERLIVLGDSACAFNPVYGQGMSVAAMTAAALDRWLGERNGALDGCGEFRHQVAACGADAWMAAAGEDLRYPTTTGATADGMTRFIHRYMNGVLELALVDEAANAAFTAVMQLAAPAMSLFGPDMTQLVARGAQVPPPTGLPSLPEPAFV